MANILFVDDEQLILSMGTDLISMMGHSVDPCASAVEAWSRLSAGTQPDLIITDVMMPGMDGRDFAAKVLNNARLQHIPILLLSGGVRKKDIRERFGDSVSFLPKPMSFKELRDAIDAALATADAELQAAS